MAFAVLLTGCGASTVSGDATPVTLAPPVPPVQTVEVGDPKNVEIPAIGAKSTLTHTGLIVGSEGPELQVPPVTQPEQASWFYGSPRPGEAGPAVILGHVDGSGRNGVFFRLHELKPGDDVLVTGDDGKVRTFDVTKVEQVDKDTFPTERVYGDTEGPELRLITCGGVFDRGVGHYTDNVVVYATLAA